MRLRKGLVSVALLAVGAVIGILGLSIRDAVNEHHLLASAHTLAERPGQAAWFRGNLHTHSLWSDGDDYPEMVADWYRRHGYNFLAFTEHNTLQSGARWVDTDDTPEGPSAFAALKSRFKPSWIVQRVAEGHVQTRLKEFEELAELNEPGRFLLLQGEEISDAHAGISIHFSAINLAAYLPPAGGSSVTGVIHRDLDAVAAQAGRSHQPMFAAVNHPNFLNALTAEDVMRARGLRFFELYNGHPLSYNNGDGSRPSTERFWDIVLTYRIAALHLPLIFGIASDDSHQYHHIPSGGAEPGRGWVMVLADALKPSSLITAMQNGRFYASTGVKLTRIIQSGRIMQVDVAAEPGVKYVIEFIGTRRGFDQSNTPAQSRTGRPIYATRRYSDDIGATLAKVDGSSGRYVFDSDDLYVRARVTSTRRHPDPSEPFQFEQAWVQPVLGPAGTAGAPGPSIAAPSPAPAAMHAELTSGFSRLPSNVAGGLLRNSMPDCSLDSIVDEKGVPVSTLPNSSKVQFGGWVADRSQPTAPDSISVILRGNNDYLAEGTNGASRADVVAATGNPALEPAGFNLAVSLAGVPRDNYEVIFVAYYGSDSRACHSRKTLTVQ